jgi:hypothetical protein
MKRAKRIHIVGLASLLMLGFWIAACGLGIF